MAPRWIAPKHGDYLVPRPRVVADLPGEDLCGLNRAGLLDHVPQVLDRRPGSFTAARRARPEGPRLPGSPHLPCRDRQQRAGTDPRRPVTSAIGTIGRNTVAGSRSRCRVPPALPPACAPRAAEGALLRNLESHCRRQLDQAEHSRPSRRLLPPSRRPARPTATGRRRSVADALSTLSNGKP